jgi:hypothetical protein
MLTIFVDEFSVRKLEDVTWEENAVDRLILGDEEKSLLLALVDSNELQQIGSYADFIPTKGKLSLIHSYYVVKLINI